MALFQFFNSFLSLFYIGFYLRDQDKLKEQLAGLLISRQIIGNLRESAVPFLMEQLKLAQLSFSMWGSLSPSNEKVPLVSETEKITVSVWCDVHDVFFLIISLIFKQDTPEAKEVKRSLNQAEVESSLYRYDGTFSDHLEMLVQMGYVVLFSSAFPLAGLCAIANNLLEIRSDAFKLVHVHQVFNKGQLYV